MPGRIAATVFSLAQKTGWPIDYILWQIPIAVITQGNHAMLWLMGSDTRRIETSDHKKAKELASLLKIEL